VPFFCPHTPHLTKNPVFLFSEEGFKRPNPFTGDVVVGSDDVVEKKLACMEALASQFYEGGCNGGPGSAPDPQDADKVAARKKQIRERFGKRFSETADRFRAKLEESYGKEEGSKFKYAEAFEICEYGRRPDKAEIQRLFPFFPAK
jgi:hypothetical protein